MNNNQKNDFKIGDKFKILIPIENLLQSENFTIKAISNLETKPVVYGKTTVPNTQNYALAGFIYEEKENSFIEEYSKNISKITIIKKEEGTDKKLSGVKFNLLDENQNVLKENLITNENGEIVLEEMMPGKYFLQEIETLENYNLNTDLLEINLDFNQELEFVVTNSIKTIPKDNKTFESIEVESVKKLPVTGY